MLTLSRALEILALTLPRFDSIEHVGSTLAAVYHDDVQMIPIRSMTTTIGRDGKLSSDELKKLMVLVLRDLQEGGRAVLDEHGLGGVDDPLGTREGVRIRTREDHPGRLGQPVRGANVARDRAPVHQASRLLRLTEQHRFGLDDERVTQSLVDVGFIPGRETFVAQFRENVIKKHRLRWLARQHRP